MAIFGIGGIKYTNYLNVADTSSSAPNYYDLQLNVGLPAQIQSASFDVYIWYKTQLTSSTRLFQFGFTDEAGNVLNTTWIAHFAYGTSSTSLSSNESSTSSSPCKMPFLPQFTDGPAFLHLTIRGDRNDSSFNGEVTHQTSTENEFLSGRVSGDIKVSGNNNFPARIRLYNQDISESAGNYFTSLVAYSHPSSEIFT
jgi:hypothetical protein